MHFSHITPNDAGRYFCTAQNVHGNVTKVAQVIVNRNEIIDNGQGGQRVQEVVEGETISLYCRSPQENASPSTIVSFRNFFINKFELNFKNTIQNQTSRTLNISTSKSITSKFTTQ